MFEKFRDQEYYTADTPRDLIDITIRKISDILDYNYPDHLKFDDGSFAVIHGSSQVLILVRPFTQDEACVECIANVVTGAKVNEDLMRFLLRKNAELHFGAFGLIFDGTITFAHSFSTSVLHEKELVTTLESVAIIADYYDDIIVDLAGGKRAQDLAESYSAD